MATWWLVDECYALYWNVMNPLALELMRSANFFASLALVGICGLIRLYRGSPTDAMRDAKMWLQYRR